jgi:hypothetical protein
VIKRILSLTAAGAVALVAVGSVAACKSDAKTANDNLSTAADNFEVYRRVVFYNSILDKYIMVIEGWCSVDFSDPNKESVICKVGGTEAKPIVKRNSMAKSDNVMAFYTQIDSTGVSAHHYRVILKPEQIIPEPEVQ